MTILQSLSPDENECFFLSDSFCLVLVTIAIHIMPQHSDLTDTLFNVNGTRLALAL